METILAGKSVGLSELKANPGAVMRKAEEGPVAILNRNKPVGYVVSPATWEAVTEVLENQTLAEQAKVRIDDGLAPVKVLLTDL